MSGAARATGPSSIVIPIKSLPPGTSVVFPPDVLAAVSMAAVQLRTLRPAITEGMTALLSASVEYLDDPQLNELMAASIDSNISTLMDAWEHNIAIDRMQPPTAAVEFALRLAQRGVPAGSLTRAYHMGQNNLLEACFQVVSELPIPSDLRFDVIHRVSDVLYRYVDWIVLHLLAAYDQERRIWLDGQSTMHAALIHAMLNDDVTDVTTFQGETGYLLNQSHLGVVVRAQAEDANAEVNRVLHAVAAIVGAVGPPMSMAVDRHNTWAWLPLGRGERRRVDCAALNDLATSSNCMLAIGSPLSGDTGFRRTHQQALQAQLLQESAVDRLRPVVSFSDEAVAVIARLAEDLVGTQIWVAETLGALADPGENAKRLRETLLTYLQTGGSYSQSSVLLNLHGNTVKYRVRKAIELRGRPIGTDRLAVELALQVCAYLGERVLRTG